MLALDCFISEISLVLYCNCHYILLVFNPKFGDVPLELDDEQWHMVLQLVERWTCDQ